MKKFKLLKSACYVSNVSMSVIANLSPILFLTFRNLYGISFSLLGALVLINFFTQLLVDLVFSLFSHKFNITVTVRIMPVLATVGLLIYAAAPIILPDAVYLGLVLGTIVFSAASGLNEVLLSPMIAAIPSENPDHEMSKLHSVYAWGVVGVVIFATLFLLIFDNAWQLLTVAFAVIPVIAGVLFAISEIPDMQTEEQESGAVGFMKNKGVWIAVLAIFLGGATECTMSQWASGYLEQALGVPKVWGDIFGVAMFAAALGLGRTLYAKIGKLPSRTVFLGAIGSAVCYAVAIFSPFAVVGLIACALTGFCASMLWPGNIIISSEKYPKGGVVLFAMMAAGGDMGASVGPQLVGIVADLVAASPDAVAFADRISVSADVLGMKAGMIVGLLFALCAIPLYYAFYREEKKKKNRSEVR